MSFTILTLPLLLSVTQLFGQLGFTLGTAIDIADAPWQASVLVNDRHHCGGVIYRNDVVLSNAQCVKWVRTDNLAVRVGSDKMDLGGQVVPVRRVIMQLLGRQPSDVVILVLAKPIEFGDNVKSIELASRSPTSNTKASVTGWAEVNTGEPVTDGVSEKPAQKILMRANLTMVEKRECSVGGFLIKRILNPAELCASKSDSTNLICQGFSGGPLVSDGKLIGIGSWNSKCDFLQSPSVYANIALIKPWISSTTRLLHIF